MAFGRHHYPKRLYIQLHSDTLSMVLDGQTYKGGLFHHPKTKKDVRCMSSSHFEELVEQC